ncbi:MAG TPA: ABC transporter permease, partial [Parafilimonas sp.]
MKLLATIQKDVRILLRDKMGLLLMFAMPVLLVIIVTSIQSSVFDVAGKNKIALLICNKDSGRLSKEFIHALDTTGMFNLLYISPSANAKDIGDEMHKKDIVISVVIDPSFTNQIEIKAKNNAGKALTSFGLEGETAKANFSNNNYLDLYYNPIIQQSLKLSIQGALSSSIQIIQSKETLKDL